MTLSAQEPERRTTGGTFWALVPVGLLGASLSGIGALSAIAMHDPGFALEQNYYDRAVHFDSQQAQWAEDARLGYRLALEQSGTLENIALALNVTDRDGNPLGGANVQLEAFANARADARRTLNFQEVSPGRYQAGLGAARSGLWELRFTVQKGAERFTQIVRADMSGGPQ
jgi:nitrogen fixation protein FixH